MNANLTEQQLEQMDKILADILGVNREQLVPEARFMEDLSADSLSTMEIVMAVEEQFGIALADEDVERARSVGELRELLGEILSRPQPARRG